MNIRKFLYITLAREVSIHSDLTLFLQLGLMCNKSIYHTLDNDYPWGGGDNRAVSALLFPEPLFIGGKGVRQTGCVNRPETTRRCGRFRLHPLLFGIACERPT
jgi:hypothetical protein